MQRKFLLASCAIAGSASFLCGILFAQEDPISPSKDAVVKNAQGDDNTPKRSFVESIRDCVRDRRQRKSGDSQMELDDLPVQPQDPPPPQSEAPFLRDLAAWLSVPIPENATPGDISFAVQQAFSIIPPYSGEVFSEESFKKYKAAFLTNKDAETFEAYHSFIKKIKEIEGKRIVILSSKE